MKAAYSRCVAELGFSGDSALKNKIKKWCVATLVSITALGVSAQEERPLWLQHNPIVEAPLVDLLLKSAESQMELDYVLPTDTITTAAGNAKFYFTVKTNEDFFTRTMYEGKPEATLTLTIHPEDNDVSTFLKKILPQETSLGAKEMQIVAFQYLSQVNHTLKNYLNFKSETGCTPAFVRAGLIPSEFSERAQNYIPGTEAEIQRMMIDIKVAVDHALDVRAERKNVITGINWGEMKDAMMPAVNHPYVPHTEAAMFRDSILPDVCDALISQETISPYRYRHGLLSNETPNQNYLTYSFTVNTSGDNSHLLSVLKSVQYFVFIKEQLLSSVENSDQNESITNMLRPLADFLLLPESALKRQNP